MITHQGLHINISYFTFMIFRTLTIGASAVYHVSLNFQRWLPSSQLSYYGRSSNVGQTQHSLGLIQVELSTSISGSHAATYVLKLLVSQIRVLYVSRRIRTSYVSTKYAWSSNEVSEYWHEILIYVFHNTYRSTTRTPHHHLPSSIVEHNALRPSRELVWHLSTQVNNGFLAVQITVFDPRRGNRRCFIPFQLTLWSIQVLLVTL